MLTSTYTNLPDLLFVPTSPVPVKDPKLLLFNDELADELGISKDQFTDEEWVKILSGNERFPGSIPISQAYAGHQFGYFVPQLGDGRAHLLGEIRDKKGRLKDIQLKGSGITPFSRNGDGRCPLGPALREYLISEAMHALGIPTTRSLAVLTTGETVYREHPHPGAILTRVAASHIRIGTFEYLASRQETDALIALTNYAIERHYPNLMESPKPFQAFYSAVAESQATLIAKWMSVGFIHGVMNTDNATISGETIDYGPCAFLDEYNPDTVFSYIDTHARYAYKNQAKIAAWNLRSLGECLHPLLGDHSTAPKIIEETIHQFEETYTTTWQSKMALKLGLDPTEKNAKERIAQFLSNLEETHGDFTNAFREANPGSNPSIIARNHHVEAALSAAESGNLDPFNTLHTLLKQPFNDHLGSNQYKVPPKPEERVQNTFCGT